MKKQEIIQVVNNMMNNIDTTVFQVEEQGKEGIGSNQFREFASICRDAECYEEVELLVQYNRAKDSKNSSWGRKMKNGKNLAECIVAGMQDIKGRSGDTCLSDLCLFFGYMYWNARIFAEKNKADSPAQNNGGGFSKGGNGGYNKGGYNGGNGKRNGR